MGLPYDFTLANGPTVLLAFVPALLNLAILAYLLARAKKNVLTYSFALFVTALLVWQSSETLVRLSATAATATFWSNALALGALLIGPFAVHFALLFTERRRLARSPLVWLLLYGPVLLIEVLSRAGLNQEDWVHRAPWGWMPAQPTPTLGMLTGLWVAGLAIATLVLLFRHASKLERGQPKRRQAFLVAGGFAVPTLQGTVTQVVFPLVGLEPIPIASTVMTAFSICTLVALGRHRFLEMPTIEERLEAAQAQVEERAQQLGEAQRIAHVGNWVWDLAGLDVLWSDEMYRIYGYPVQSFAVTFEKAMERVEPMDRVRIQESVARELARGQPGELPLSEYRIRLPDGRVRILQGRGRLEVDAEGRPVRLLGTVQDVTDLKAAEQADRLAFERLLEIEKLRSLDEFKTRFLNMASHELNTPITPVRLQLHLLRAGTFGALSSEQAHAVEIVERNMGRLASLVQDLLDVARLQGGALKLRLGAVDVRQLAREAVDAYRAAAADRRIALDLQEGPPHVVQADARRLSQVFVNLLSNAVKFTPPGGRIHVDVNATPNAIQVAVQDSGSGFDASQQRRLFQPFSQVHDDPVLQQAGTGLGLFICRGIMEAHGGRIWAESNGQGQGARFVFEVPLVPVAAAEPPVGPPPA